MLKEPKKSEILHLKVRASSLCHHDTHSVVQLSHRKTAVDMQRQSSADLTGNHRRLVCDCVSMCVQVYQQNFQPDATHTGLMLTCAGVGGL